LVSEVHVSTGSGREILRQLANDMTTEHLEEMEDVDLQRQKAHCGENSGSQMTQRSLARRTLAWSGRRQLAGRWAYAVAFAISFENSGMAAISSRV
jgi:hypothetical protein